MRFTGKKNKHFCGSRIDQIIKNYFENFIFFSLQKHISFRQRGQPTCTIQTSRVETGKWIKDVIGVNGTATFSAELPVPIKLCESCFYFTKIN